MVSDRVHLVVISVSGTVKCELTVLVDIRYD